MAGTPLLFGADGGGTKTLGVLAATDGRELARSQVGATNPNVIGIDTAATHLADLLISCCDLAGQAPVAVGAGVFGLAGAGNPVIQKRLTQAFERVMRDRDLPMPKVQFETDARIALEGAFQGGPGIIVIAGTGSSVLGKSPDGTIRLVGGWGRTVGDEGSGYYVGLEAVRAAARALDGRETPGFLQSILAEEFGLTSRERLVNSVYQEGFVLPSVAPAVMRAAEQGDPLALRIFERGAGLLAEQVRVLVHSYASLPEIGVVFVGGLIDHECVYTRILREAILPLSSAVRVHSPRGSPVLGAVLLARQMLSL
jgi:N-acetylglucosamine kinase-like BadF-type ATPase